MLERLNTYNWEEAFRCAQHLVEPTPGFKGSKAPFYREDVERIILIAEGANDGDPWVGAFKLDDGRYGVVRAWCDYTGWG